MTIGDSRGRTYENELDAHLNIPSKGIDHWGIEVKRYRKNNFGERPKLSHLTTEELRQLNDNHEQTMNRWGLEAWKLGRQ